MNEDKSQLINLRSSPKLRNHLVQLKQNKPHELMRNRTRANTVLDNINDHNSSILVNSDICALPDIRSPQ